MGKKDCGWAAELRRIFWAMSLDDRKDPVLWYEKEGKLMLSLSGGMAFCSLLAFYTGEWRGGLILVVMFALMFFFGFDSYLSQKGFKKAY